jgi:hypothetical protein
MVSPHLLADDCLQPERSTPSSILFGPGQREESSGRQFLAESLRESEVFGIVRERSEIPGRNAVADQLPQL